MEFTKRKNFFIFLVSAGIAFVLCVISLPQREANEVFGESLRETLTVFSNFSTEEWNFLQSFHHLLIVDSWVSGENEVFLATKDNDLKPQFGRIRVFRMEDSLTGDYIKIFINNVTRALHSVKLKKVWLKNLELNIVQNVADFERKWKNSRFIDCLGLTVSNASRVIPLSYVDDLVKFRDYIESYNISLFLMGGTLLGWYRECSFIRDTTDVDFGAKVGEIENWMLDEFQKTTLFYLYWILGKIDDSLELSFYSRGIKIDVFFLYRNETNDWVGGMIVPKRKKLRWVYPHIDTLCTGDLLGKLFYVPCNVESVLEADYGKTWKEPHSTATFVWYKSHNNIQNVGYWKTSEWCSVYRTFKPKRRTLQGKAF